jgi:pimeloyl-ACP methyl ester carboxylesterase
MERPNALSIVPREIGAYVRLLGLSGVRRPKSPLRTAEFGVIFVAGLGATSRQFGPLQRALRSECAWFDAFEYATVRSIPRIAEQLGEFVDRARSRCPNLVLVGHSLGGVLVRDWTRRGPEGVVGWVSICAPLQGTTRARFSPHPALRILAPGSDYVVRLGQPTQTPAVPGLSIGVRFDQFVVPYQNAFADGSEQTLLEDGGHTHSLFDPRVHARVAAFVSKRFVGSGSRNAQPASLLDASPIAS